MPRPSHERYSFINVGDIAADADAVKHPFFYTKNKIQIKKIFMGSKAAVAAADTNYQNIKVMNGAVEIKKVSTGPAASGQSFVAGDFVEFTPVVGTEEIPANTNLEINYSKTGTGMAVTGLTIGIQWIDIEP